MGISQDSDEARESKRLLSLARKGDAPAFCRLVEPLEQRLFRQALALCHDTSLAEDLVAETMVEAWKSLTRYNETCRFTTWLYSILLHRHQKALRHKKSRPISLGSLPPDESTRHQDILESVASKEVSPAEHAIQEETSAELRAVIDTLPEEHRQVILLRFFAEASLGDIAAVIGCPEGTVKSRLHHALKKLQRVKLPMNLLDAGRDK